MRATLPLLLLVCVLPGCTDSLGVGAECAAEKGAVLRAHGPPDETESGAESELWAYYDEGITYEFSWAGGGCEVTQRPTAGELLPPLPPYFPAERAVARPAGPPLPHPR